jgi:hypothetical protein
MVMQDMTKYKTISVLPETMNSIDQVVIINGMKKATLVDRLVVDELKRLRKIETEKENL